MESSWVHRCFGRRANTTWVWQVKRKNPEWCQRPNGCWGHIPRKGRLDKEHVEPTESRVKGFFKTAVLSYILQTITFIQVYNSVILSKFAELCNHRHNPILAHFHFPKKILCAYLQLLPVSTPHPQQQPIYLPTLWIHLSGHLMQMEYTIRDLLGLAFSTTYIFQVHPYANTYQYFVSFYSRIREMFLHLWH